MSAKKNDSQSGEAFVNVGLQRWEKLRAEWRRPKAGSAPRAEVHAKNIDVEEFMERVFSVTLGGALPEPIPLGQMIDILIDSWESEGLFD